MVSASSATYKGYTITKTAYVTMVLRRFWEVLRVMQRLKNPVKFFAFMLIVVGSLLFIPSGVSAFSGEGSGTPSDPYIITSCGELQDMASDVVAHYELANDIDCSGGPFQPVGDNGSPFMGSLNGNGYTISDLSITATSDDAGLFGATYEAEIFDLFLSTVDVAAETYENVGGLVGNAGYTTITNVHASDVDIAVDEGTNIGGLVGQLGGSSISRSSVTDLDFYSDDGAENIGGLVGYMVGPSTISNTFTNGELQGTENLGGLIGQIGAGPTSLSNSYAATLMGSGINSNSLVGLGSAAFGSGVYASGDVAIGEEVDGWNFDTIWYVRPGNHPGLLPTHLPAMLCEETITTDTTAEASCSTARPLDGDPVWELRYKAYGFTDWISLPSEEGASFDITLTDLQPGTQYQISFRFVDAIGTGPWGVIDAETTGSDDIDEDSIANIEEASGPNDGDGNHDGQPDAEQTNVATMISPVTGEYATLEVGDECSITRVVISPASDFSTKDTSYRYPNGLMDFNLDCASPGATVSIRQIYHDVDLLHFVLRKYNSNTDEYTTVEDAAIQGNENDDGSYIQVAYEVTDGGELDEDGEANGEITDPAGLATTEGLLADTGSSTTYVLFAATLLLVGGVALSAYETRRKHLLNDR